MVKKAASSSSIHPSSTTRKGDTIALISDCRSWKSEQGEPKSDDKAHEVVKKAEGGSSGGGVVGALRVMFGSAESASFFAAVALSGMASGVADTFLFVW